MIVLVSKQEGTRAFKQALITNISVLRRTFTREVCYITYVLVNVINDSMISVPPEIFF